MNTLIISLSFFLSGWAISDIGHKLGIPFWTSLIIAVAFSYLLAGAATA